MRAAPGAAGCEGRGRTEAIRQGVAPDEHRRRRRRRPAGTPLGTSSDPLHPFQHQPGAGWTLQPGGHAFVGSRACAAPQRQERRRRRCPEPLRVPRSPTPHPPRTCRPSTVEEALAKAASVGVTTLVQVGCDVKARAGPPGPPPGPRRRSTPTVALHPERGPAHRAWADPDGWSRQGARVAGGDGRPRRGRSPEIDRAGRPPARQAASARPASTTSAPDPRGMAAQERSFRAHIEIAKRHGKALVIHDPRRPRRRPAGPASEEGAPERTVFHCYSGDAAMAEICARAGYFMSFAGTVTFKNAQNLRDALAVAPLELVLGGDRRPVPDPGALPRTAERALSRPGHGPRRWPPVRGIDEDALSTALAANTARAFGY
ncbi:TatD family hydrolase [Streptomyces sp. L7]